MGYWYWNRPILVKPSCRGKVRPKAYAAFTSTGWINLRWRSASPSPNRMCRKCGRMVLRTPSADTPAEPPTEAANYEADRTPETETAADTTESGRKRTIGRLIRDLLIEEAGQRGDRGPEPHRHSQRQDHRQLGGVGRCRPPQGWRRYADSQEGQVCRQTTHR